MCLRALESDPTLDGAERIVVCGSDADAESLAAALPASIASDIAVQVATGGSPARRAAGVAAARGDLVAVLNEDYRPAAGWAATAIAFDDDADVLAGEVHPAPGSKGSALAAFLWEYLHWAPAGRREQLGAAQARLAPAGAVVYRRSAIDPGLLAAARDEMEYHARMHEAGLRFVREPRLRLEYAAPNLAEFLRLRAKWSFDWASGRAEGISVPARWIAGAARLAWPPVAVWRFLRRAAGAGTWRWPAITALPYAPLFACAEGWGEVRGYWSRRG